MLSPRSSPPTLLRPLMGSPMAKGSDSEADIIDFSVRRSPIGSHDDLFTLSGKSSMAGSPPLGFPRAGDSPLDLSVPRKRAADALLEAAAAQAQGKMAHMDLSKGIGPWGIPLPPHLASTLALRPEFASLKPDLALWNGKLKTEPLTPTKLPPFPSNSTPSEASKALERMSELSKFGGDTPIGLGPSDLFRNSMSGSSGGRANAWQSHWLSKGQDATKDVLKCVWCKASFNTLADLTTHMKEAKHCGVNLPPPVPPTSSCPPLPPHMPSSNRRDIRDSNHKPPVSSPGASGSSSNDLVSNIKETMPLPRKLVRGQDVWLGKGAEQTRQILKCMWCGQSFKSLADMTRHMQQTQHYTNIISQEQIISWKSPEEKSNSQTHVNAVLTCKVCDQAFSSLKELSNHMVKYAHYKEHIMRSITESGSRRRQTREKRKKSLPVRKLLELERAQQDFRNPEIRSPKECGAPARITCEKCGDKIDTHMFVDHIRSCLGTPGREMLKPSLLSPDPDIDISSRFDSSKDSDSEDKKSPDRHPRESLNDSDHNKNSTSVKKEAPSVLNAIEKLIEKSFDSGKTKTGSPLGSSILRRLGIDESTDYSKPLMEPQLMGMYATFSRLHGGPISSTSFNLPPSFGSSERGFGMRGPDSVMSPGADSDTRDTFSRSPLRPNSRGGSRPASTGSVTRDGSVSERSLELMRPDRPNSLPDECGPTENGTDHSDMDRESVGSREAMDVKQEEPAEQNGDANDREHNNFPPREENKVKDELRVKDEFKLKEEPERHDEEFSHVNPVKSEAMERDSPVNALTHLAVSPNGSSRSGTPHSDTSNRGGSSLAGLSALIGATGEGGPGGSAHPLAALQKLCDKTETQPRPAVTSSSSGPQATPGAILAFSWACNDAVTADSIMKCAFCDTPFISKGAYRHHLSKMHFVKDGVIPESTGNKNNSNSGSGNNNGGKVTPATPTPPAPTVDESPHSKFLKYTELAKQLSSK